MNLHMYSILKMEAHSANIGKNPSVRKHMPESKIRISQMHQIYSIDVYTGDICMGAANDPGTPETSIANEVGDNESDTYKPAVNNDKGIYKLFKIILLSVIRILP